MEKEYQRKSWQCVILKAMKKMRHWLAYPLVFILSLAWFALYQPWGGFDDPDAFYHAKMASLISQHGPLRAFPWMDLTFFDKGFSDHHILFHLLLVPFVRIFGMFPGTQIAAVLFAAGFITILYASLRRMRTAHPEVWTLLAALNGPLLIRLSLAKASPLALIWFVLGLMSICYAILKRRSARDVCSPFAWPCMIFSFLVGLGYALSHGGWIILFVGYGCLFLGSLLVDWLVYDVPFRDAWWDFPWCMPLLAFLGALVGLVVHPNFPQDILFLKTLLIDISWKVPFAHVQLGDEWQPSTVKELWGGLGALLVAGTLVVYGLIFAPQRPLDRGRMKQAIGLGILTALLLAITFKSRRGIEYLVPSLVLWLAVLWTCVDVRQCLMDLWQHWRALTGKWVKPITVLLIAIVLVIHGYDEYIVWRNMHRGAHPFDEYGPAMRAIAAQAAPQDRVFHSDWDEFPQLWALDDQARYIVGLDPTLLWLSNPSLSDLYRDIATGQVKDHLYEDIRDQFHARFVFVERKQHQAFEKNLQADPRFVELYHDDVSSAYELSTVSH